jgi:hypothetical protein
MTTLHIENTVHDFAEWKAVFDKFERLRADNGVRSYRMARDVADPRKVTVDLEFDSREDAEGFRGKLEQIWTTPQSIAQLVDHATPMLLETVVEQTLS